VTDGPAVGSLLRLQSGRFLFLGIQGNIYDMVAKQDFGSILKYRNETGTVSKRIRCVVPRGQSWRLGLEEGETRTEESGGYVRFYASGLLQYAAGGTVFGIVEAEK
jgi:hypothetical protein